MVCRECAQEGFYKFRRISIENSLSSTGDELGIDLHVASSVHAVVYVLVTNKFATYYELKYKYDIWEVLDLYEMAMVHLYNRNVTVENMKKK